MTKKLHRGFTLIELLVVITIIAILAGIGLNSFQSSQKKSRDANRKSDLRQISHALEAYLNDKEQYPPNNGDYQLAGCGVLDAETCEWEEEFSDQHGTVYMVQLPSDPTSVGRSYYYETDVTNQSFQIYARLENTLDIDVQKDVDDNSLVYEGVSCGTVDCNYGISSTNTTVNTGRTLVVE